MIVILILFFLCSVQSHVSLHQGTLHKDNAPIILKGVGYSPVPIGADPTLYAPYGDYFTVGYANIYKRDLPILRSLGVNTLRLWGWGNGANHVDFLNTAYNNGVNPIYVLPQFWMGPGTYPDLANPTVQQQVKTDFALFLTSVKSHPAVIGYIIGSDLNAEWNYGHDLASLFNLLDELAQYAHSVNSTYLVTTALNDVDSNPTITTFDGVALDFWSINVYRGCTFGSMFTDYQKASKKPLFVSEYGIDSFNDNTLSYDPALQANCVTALAKELLLNNQTALGGAVVEYVDEYWKGKLGISDARHPGCPNYNAQLHANCGYPNPSFPDLYANQAWFGIVNASFSPRPVATSLQALWMH